MLIANAYINGKFIKNGKKGNIFSPETNEIVGQTISLGKSDIKLAYNSANQAQSA
jgi:acyl-CoA reductase-like NAD-dependent aldehyde dehydrogenase